MTKHGNSLPDKMDWKRDLIKCDFSADTEFKNLADFHVLFFALFFKEIGR